MEQNGSDWSIESLYRQAWTLVKKHKVLWLFGMAAAVASSNFNLRIPDFTSDDMQKYFNGSQQQGGDSVLGNSPSVVFDLLGQLFTSVPVWLYVLLGLELVVFGIICIGLSLIYSNWANASLLTGIQMAIQKKQVSIAETSERALSKTIPLLKTTFIPTFLLALMMIAVMAMLAMGIAIAPSGLRALFIILLIVWTFALLIAWVLLSLTLIWAAREVIVHNKKPKAALVRGYHLAKKKLWSMLLLGVVTNVMIIILIAIPVALLVGLIAGGAIAYSGNQSLGISFLVVGGTFLFLLVLVGSIVQGIIVSFKATVWSLAYRAIKDLYHE